MGNRKQGICMADGGITQESPEQLMARMAAKYGAPTGATQQPQPQSTQQPPQQAPQQPPQKSNPLGIMSVLKGRSAQIDKAVNGYADGGIAGHVKFEGKGGPRDDQIPVKVAGQEINVSNKEQALIIPAKTAANAQAMEMIKQIIADSNDGRQPDMGGGDSNFAEGGIKKPSWRGFLEPAPTANFDPQTHRGVAPILPNVAAGAPVNPLGGENPLRSVAQALPSDSPMRKSIEANTASYQKPEQTAPAPAPVAAGIQPGRAINDGSTFHADPFGAQPSKLSVPASTDTSFMTGKAQFDATGKQASMNTPDSSGGGFTAGNTSYNVNPSSQDGISKVTATGKNPLYTNINPEQAVAGLKNQSITGDTQEGIDRFARANAIRQEMIDSQPQGGIGILGDGGIEAANAEKTARWRQDELLAEARRGNQAAVGAAINANASTANAATNAAANANAEAGRVGVAMRGQDMTAQNEAARLAGNPNDNKLKQAQAQGITAGLESTAMIAEIQKKAIAGDPQAMATYQALTGKAKPASDRFMTVQGGEEVGADGMTKIKKPSGVFDAQTGQFVPIGAGQQQAQAPASALEFLKKNPSQSAAFKAKYGYIPEGF